MASQSRRSSPVANSDAKPAGFRSRRSHRKSRMGCIVCKRRRVKCGEEKPSCERCYLHGVECKYEYNEHTGAPDRIGVSEVENRSPSAGMFSMSLAATAENIDSVLRPAIPPGISRENLQALAHFEMFTTHTLGAPIARHIIRTKALPLAFSAPYLMHAMLATSTTHLSRLIPTYQPQTPPEYHWHKAITLYQKEIASIQPENMDSIFSTCMILAVHSFTFNDTNPASSWVFPVGPVSNWLLVQGGLTPLVDQCASYVHKSIWCPLFEDQRAKHKHTLNTTYTRHLDDEPGINGIPASFVELCGLDETSTGENNPYLLPLRSISALINLDLSSASFGKLITFIGRVKGDYLALIQMKDPRALLILSYWFGLMCMVDQWWVHNRVRLECRAICAFLENHGDPRIVRLLEFPMLACGHQMVGSFEPGSKSEEAWAEVEAGASSSRLPNVGIVPKDALSIARELMELSSDFHVES